MCYNPPFILKCFFAIFLFFSVQGLQAQVKISGPSNVCIGNLAYFTGSSSMGIKSSKWEFGDGYTSANLSPFHLYKKPGTYKVRLILKLNNNNIASDSVNIVVDELPKAVLFQDGPQDSCLYTNQFSFRDKSTPAKSGQTIEKRLVLWGDGISTIMNPEILMTWSSTTINPRTYSR
jgi:PKD repeat protein